MARIDGIIAKRNWAEHHLYIVERGIDDFLNSDPYPVSIERYPENGIYLARLVNPKEFPATEMALMIGDCVHNMRSALDYIAWELAGGDIFDKETMFPIFETKAGFDTRGRKRIKKIASREAVALIEKFQPYNTPDNKALSAIQDIDTTDKHKLLTLTLAVAEHVSFDGHMPADPMTVPVGKAYHTTTLYNTTTTINSGVPLVHNAVMAAFNVTPPSPNMQVDFKFTPQVEFADMTGYPTHLFVVPNLKLMLKEIDGVIQSFRPFFCVFAAFYTVMAQLGHKLT